MQSTQQGPSWTPHVSTDLSSVSGAAFQKLISDFNDWSNSVPIEPLPTSLEQNGWCDITPELAEKLLRRNKLNRRVSLETVRKYARIMKAGEWRKNGQTGILCNGEVYDMQHRLWACYLSGATFPIFLITDVPPQSDLFAYIDDMRVRSLQDILETAGETLGGPVAAAIKFAWKYDNRALSILRQPAIRPLSNAEGLLYSRQYPGLGQACHEMASNYSNANTVIGNKGIAGFVAYKIIERHGIAALAGFMGPLGASADLEDNDPIKGLRVRIKKAEDDCEDMKPLHLLALVIKAFNLHITDATLGRRGLFITDVENYPMFEDVEVEPQDEAAE